MLIRRDEDLEKLNKNIPNVAPKGSILKVSNCCLWHSPAHTGSYVSMYSTNDINLYQMLYPFPKKLVMSGTTHIKKVSSYLLEVRYDI